jgi:4-carboxymuconolactone decarboxylase
MSATTENESRHGRLPWLLPEELDEQQRVLYDRLLGGPRSPSQLVDERGRLHGPFNARLLDPELGTALQDVSVQLRFGTFLDGRIRELVILEVARSEKCNFEWSGHSRAALASGLTETEVAGIRSGGAIEGLSDEETTARRVAQTLLATNDLTDDLFAEAEATLGLPRLFDVVTLVGQYRHTALALRVWRVPNRPGDAPVFWS